MKICVVSASFYSPPIFSGIEAALGAILKCLVQQGHQVKVIDLNNRGENIPQRLEEAQHYDLVGISIKSFTAKSGLEVSKEVKARQLICGGPHITLDG